MNKIPIDSTNYHKVGIGTIVSHPGLFPGKATINDRTQHSFVSFGDWVASWDVPILASGPSYFDLKFFMEHKYFFVTRKPTVII